MLEIYDILVSQLSTNKLVPNIGSLHIRSRFTLIRQLVIAQMSEILLNSRLHIQVYTGRGDSVFIARREPLRCDARALRYYCFGIPSLSRKSREIMRRLKPTLVHGILHWVFVLQNGMSISSFQLRSMQYFKFPLFLTLTNSSPIFSKYFLRIMKMQKQQLRIITERIEFRKFGSLS